MASESVAQRIDDLVKGSLRDLDYNRIIQASQEKQSTPLFDMVFKKDNMRLSSGVGIQRNVQTKKPGTFVSKSFTDPDNFSIKNFLSNFRVDWTHHRQTWAYYIQEMLMNKGENRIVNIIEPRENAAITEMQEAIDDLILQASSPSTAGEIPLGITHWVTAPTSTSAAHGFNGGAASGWTTKGGLTPDSVNNRFLMNYTGGFKAWSLGSVVKAIRRAQMFTKWKPPVGLKGQQGPEGQRFRLLMGFDEALAFGEIGQNVNQNMGTDFGKFDGQMTFSGALIIPVAAMNTSAYTGHIIGKDFATSYPIGLRGDVLRREGPKEMADNSDGRQVKITLTFNYLDEQPWRNFYLVKAADATM